MSQMNSAGIMGSVGEFEKVFEDMDVKTAEMDAAMDNVYSSTIDAGEVENLIGEMTGAVALKEGQGLQNNVATGAITNPNAQA